ncbi:hypothetical protein TGRH88_041870 [Toxoplasma gondii]|uniref:Uncharacterized protein n=2 Tax=Toxoplasma gondii TaxID=5811 RepID=A0A7J6K0Y8_TOXGO|nr:hypothetical protein TGRH88_041870 [Toxoplasma gondii]
MLRLFLSAAAEAQAVREEMSRLVFEVNASTGSQSGSPGASGCVSSRLRALREQMRQADEKARDYAKQRRLQVGNAQLQEEFEESLEDLRLAARLQPLFAVHLPAGPRFGPLAAQGVAAPGQAPPPQGPGPPIPGVDPPQVVPGHLAQGPGAGPPQLGPGAAAAGQGPPLPGQGPPFPAQGPHPPRGHPPGPPQPGQNVFGLRPPRSPGSFNR